MITETIRVLFPSNPLQNLQIKIILIYKYSDIIVYNIFPKIKISLENYTL
jgi:hypothetical protein